MKKLNLRHLVSLMLVLLLAIPNVSFAKTNAKSTGFVTTNGTQFTLDGKPFYYAGTNNYYLIYKSHNEIDNVIEDASNAGLKVIRTWGHLDVGIKTDQMNGNTPVFQDNSDGMGSKDGVYIQYFDKDLKKPVVNEGEDGLGRLDYAIYKAGQEDVKLILTLTNNWEQFGGMKQYVNWAKSIGINVQNKDDFYTNETIKGWYKDYVSTVLNHVNPYTGLKYKDDPTIFAWELANEPRCSTDTYCKNDTLYKWAKEMAAYVKSVDSNHMLATGEEGFFNYEYNSFPQGESKYVYHGCEGADFNKLTSIPDIDFGTVHLYCDQWGLTKEQAEFWFEHHKTQADKLNKPVILEEFNWKDRSERPTVLKRWFDVLDNLGYAGVHFWMIASMMDDGKLCPDYDQYTNYFRKGEDGINPTQASSDVIMAFAKTMEAKNGGVVTPTVKPSPTATATATVAPTVTPAATATAVPTVQPTTPVTKSGFVSANGTNFYLDGKPFYFAGANAYDLFTAGDSSSDSSIEDICNKYMDQKLIDSRFAAMQEAGVKVVRTWGFSTESWHGFEKAPGKYEEAQFMLFDYIMASAAKHDIKVIITLENYWEAYGGIDAKLRWAGLNGGQHKDRAKYFTNEQCKQYYKDYAEHFINRTNYFTGVKYKDDPTIFAWDLMNEPRYQDVSADESKNGTTLRKWVDEMAGYIKSLDPNHMVCVGIEGHGTEYNFGGDEGNPFVYIQQSPYIDFCSAHPYPDEYWAALTPEQNADLMRQWIKDAHEKVGKPFFVGEFNVHSSLPYDKYEAYWRSVFDVIDEEGAGGGLMWEFNYRQLSHFSVQPGDKILTYFKQHSDKMAAKTEQNPAPTISPSPSVSPSPVPTPEPPTIDSKEINFTEGKANDAVVTIVTNGYSLNNVKVDGTQIISGKDFTLAGSQLRFYANYLNTLNAGDHKVTFTFNGYKDELTLTIKVAKAPVITPTPSPSVTPTATPIVTPTVIPSQKPEANDKVAVKFNMQNTGATTNAIAGNYEVEVKKAVNLKDIEIRYYFTNAEGFTYNGNVDNAGVNLNRDPWYVDFTRDSKVTIAKDYFSITFTKDLQLQPGDKFTIGARVWSSNWQNFNQADDKSFTEGPVALVK